MALIAVLGLDILLTFVGANIVGPAAFRIFALRFTWPAVQNAVLSASLLHRHRCATAAQAAELVSVGTSPGFGSDCTACVLGQSDDLPEGRALGEPSDGNIARGDPCVGRSSIQQASD